MEIKHREFLKTSTKTCHASTMCFYQDKPIFAWFGGTVEGALDSSIYVQVGDKVHALINKHRIPMWNPILFPFNDRLFLFVKAGIFCDRWQSFVMDISDIFNEGFEIGSVPMEILPAGLNGPVKTKPIFHNGVIYCGSSVETIYDWTSYIESYIYDPNMNNFVFVSRTNPLTAPKVVYKNTYGYTAVSTGIIQPSLWVDSKGHLNAFMRASRGLGKIYYSCSKDDVHELWSKPAPTKFDNPNSSVDTVYKNGRLFLVYNPSSLVRSPLDLVELSEETFDIVDKITITEEILPKNSTYSPELSYPYLVEYNGELHLTYTWGRSKIEYCIISVR